MPGYPDYSRMPGCMQMRECPDRKPVPGSPDTSSRMNARILSIAQAYGTYWWGDGDCKHANQKVTSGKRLDDFATSFHEYAVEFDGTSHVNINVESLGGNFLSCRTLMMFQGGRQNIGTLSPPTTAWLCDGTEIWLSHFHSHFEWLPPPDQGFWIVGIEVATALGSRFFSFGSG